MPSVALQLVHNQPMLTVMAGRTRTLAAAIALLTIVGAACSSNGDEDTLLELDAPTSSTTTTTTTTVSTTTTTEPTTTTLSEQELAEAEVAQLVTDYWLTEVDTSIGEMGLEYLTDPVAQRNEEIIDRNQAQGKILRDQGQKRIETIAVTLDLPAGEGEVKACLGSASEVVDAVTLERIGNAADPEFLSTVRFLVKETPAGWKIYELYWTQPDGSLETCEFDA